jgi:hypothetical protein
MESLSALETIVGTLGAESRYLTSAQLLAAWWRLYRAKQSMMYSDVDLSESTQKLIDQTLLCFHHEAKRRDLGLIAVIGFAFMTLMAASVILLAFFPKRAALINNRIDQIQLGNKLTIPVLNWNVKVPKLPIGSLLKYIFVLGIIVKIAERFGSQWPYRSKAVGQLNRKQKAHLYETHQKLVNIGIPADSGSYDRQCHSEHPCGSGR